MLHRERAWRKKQEAPRAVDTPLHAEQPGCFTILGNPLRCLAARSWGCLVTSSVNFLLTKRTTWLRSTNYCSLGPWWWQQQHENMTCKLCFLHLTAQASSQYEICCVMLIYLHIQSVLVDTWFALRFLICTTVHCSSRRNPAYLLWDAKQSPVSSCDGDTALLSPKTTHALS